MFIFFKIYFLFICFQLLLALLIDWFNSMKERIKDVKCTIVKQFHTSSALDILLVFSTVICCYLNSKLNYSQVPIKGCQYLCIFIHLPSLDTKWLWIKSLTMVWNVQMWLVWNLAVVTFLNAHALNHKEVNTWRFSIRHWW